MFICQAILTNTIHDHVIARNILNVSCVINLHSNSVYLPVQDVYWNMQEAEDHEELWCHWPRCVCYVSQANFTTVLTNRVYENHWNVCLENYISHSWFVTVELVLDKSSVLQKILLWWILFFQISPSRKSPNMKQKRTKHRYWWKSCNTGLVLWFYRSLCFVVDVIQQYSLVFVFCI